MGRGRKGSLTQEWVDGARLRLQALNDTEPEKDRVMSKQAVIEILAAEINALLKRGYSLTQIVESVNHGEETFTSTSLRSFLKRAENGPPVRRETSTTRERGGDPSRDISPISTPRSKLDGGQKRPKKISTTPNPIGASDRPRVKTKEERSDLGSARTSSVTAAKPVRRMVQTGGSFDMDERDI